MDFNMRNMDHRQQADSDYPSLLSPTQPSLTLGCGKQGLTMIWIHTQSGIPGGQATLKAPGMRLWNNRKGTGTPFLEEGAIKTVANPSRDLVLYAEGVTPGATTIDYMYTVGNEYFESILNVTVIKVELAIDGKHDPSAAMNFTDPAYQHCNFWVNDDHDVISGGEEDDADPANWIKDCNRNVGDTIACKRDLEDFTRLQIRVDDNTANMAGITYWLKFENGSPSVNIFEAVNDSMSYLQNGTIASQQIQKTELLTVTGTEQQLPNRYIKTGNLVSPFILEGRAAGKGDLTFIVKQYGRIISQKAVTLDLRPITAFYEKYVVAISAGDNVYANSGGNANSTTYTPETDEYVLYVHGWNMADWEKDRWTETMFKRLWWQGYKGHMGGFQWPTHTGWWTYNSSELRAWRSGQALNNRITSLNASYPGQIRVLAHSMGNVVMGEALCLFPSSVVHTYVAAQAAIPADCYDSDMSPNLTDYRTPNIYGHYFSGMISAMSYLINNSKHSGTMVSYFNEGDYALSWWEFNNRYKKPDVAAGYDYIEGDLNIDTYFPGAGDKFVLRNSPRGPIERTLSLPQSTFEVFARCAQARSKALGQERSVSGFGTCRDLQEWGYDTKRYSHSREFKSNVADEDPFWSAFIEDVKLNH